MKRRVYKIKNRGKSAFWSENDLYILVDESADDNYSDAALRNGTTVFYSDFLSTTATGNPPFTGGSISGGSIFPVLDINVLGAIFLNSGTSTTSGYSLMTNNALFSTDKGMEFNAIVKFRPSTDASTTRIGFSNSNITIPQRGAFFEINEHREVIAKSRDNSIETASPIIANLNNFHTAGFGYFHFKIEFINRNIIKFTLYNVSNLPLLEQTQIENNNEIASVTLTTNYPQAELGVGLVSFKTAGTTSIELCAVDYMSFSLPPKRRGSLN